MRLKSSTAVGMLVMCGLALVAGSAIAEDASNMIATSNAWETEYNNNNLAGVAAMYAEDGCRMPPNAETAQGTEAILAVLEEGRAQGMVKVAVAVTKSEASGDLAHAIGTYSGFSADGGQIDQGKWMNVSKMVDGEWKISCDIWNSNLPLEGGMD